MEDRGALHGRQRLPRVHGGQHRRQGVRAQPGPLIHESICQIIGAMPFETGKAQIDTSRKREGR